MSTAEERLLRTSSLVPTSVLNDLHVLCSALEANRGRDCIELRLSTHAPPSVCVYRRDRIETRHIRTLFCRIGLGASIEKIFWLFFARIPAERYAIRLSTGRKLSVFFKIDVPLAAIGAVADSLGLTAASFEPVVSYFQAAGRAPCGLACEISEGADPRLRLYDAVSSLEPALERLSRAGLGSETFARDAAAVCAAGATPLVVNFSIEGKAELTTKIEIPQVSLAAAHRRLSMSPAETEAASRAAAAMRRLEVSRLNYFGLRQLSSGRELSFYIDARKAAE